jgi:hypothetical protein
MFVGRSLPILVLLYLRKQVELWSDLCVVGTSLILLFSPLFNHRFFRKLVEKEILIDLYSLYGYITTLNDGLHMINREQLRTLSVLSRRKCFRFQGAARAHKSFPGK